MVLKVKVTFLGLGFITKLGILDKNPKHLGSAAVMA